jgi:putative ABC transport system substrate-binding protein
MNRRKFVAWVGGAAVSFTWAIAALAQQADRLRRIGVLMSSPNDSEGQARIAAFRESLERLCWTDGRNVRLDIRWALPANDANLVRSYTMELVALDPDVILAQGAATLAPLLQATQHVPIVFTIVADPVGAGYVESLARPGGNSTGFLIYDYSIGAKWLELLKEIAPSVKRAAVLRDPVLLLGPPCLLQSRP